MLTDLITALEETLFLVLIASFLSCVFGSLLGLCLLWVSSQKNVFFAKVIHPILSHSTSICYSLPYFVILILMIPFLQRFLGNETSFISTLLPLTLVGTLGFASKCEQILKMSSELSDLVQTTGASFFQGLTKISLKEKRTVLLSEGLTLTQQILGYSLIAGLFAPIGLGSLWIEKVYHTLHWNYAFAILGVLLILIQSIRFTSYYFSHD